MSTNTSAKPTVTRGGTFYICEQPTFSEVAKLDKNGHKTRYTETRKTGSCTFRSRIASGPAKFLRHARRNHA